MLNIFIVIFYNVPMVAVKSGIVYHRKDLEQFLSQTLYTPRAIRSYTRLLSCRFNFVLQAPRVIVKRYNLCYNVTFDTFCLLCIFFTIDAQDDLCPKSDEFGHYRAIVLVFHLGPVFFY